MARVSVLTRRSFLSVLSVPLALPVAALAVSRTGDEYHFHYDHVLGSSLDLVVSASSARAADRVHRAVLAEVERLAGILSTYDAASEISRFAAGMSSVPSRELDAVLTSYEAWARRTGGIVSSRPFGASGPLNVDAIGKAYIIDQAARAGRREVPELTGLLLNIGGDIVVSGRSREIAIADPAAPHDNARPLTSVTLADAAMATSGDYARGAHIVDPRTGRAVSRLASATVVAGDCVTANALATALCVTGSHDGLRLVRETAGAEALVVASDGSLYRSVGFSKIERPQTAKPPATADWPPGYEVSVALMVTGLSGFRAKRPYVAVWIEDAKGKLVRLLAIWGDRARYLVDLSGLWQVARNDQNLISSVARATRAPGRYLLVWDGLDEQGKPVPTGLYRITVEANQEHGAYGTEHGTIVCAGTPATLRLKATDAFDAVMIQYGPRAPRT